GGMTYVSLSPDGTHGIIDAATLPAAANTNQVGNIVTDYSHPTGTTNLLSGEPTHRMYAVFGAPRDATDNAQAQLDTNKQGAGAYNHVDTIYLARSDDGGLTWTDTKVFGVDPASHRELNMLFPVVDVDKAGNVYVVWSDGFKVEYAASSDGGKTFSAPYQVNRDNRGLVQGTGAEKPDPGKSDLFPWLAAGADGYLDLVWYHGQGGAPTSNLAYRDPGDKNTSWTVAFAQLGNAHRSVGGKTSPTVLNYSEAVTPVVHTGDICQNGTFCSLVPVPGAPFSTGDRSLLDFFEVAIDKQGRANIALADNVDSPGAYISAYIRQTSGVNVLTGKAMPVEKISTAQLLCSSDAAFTDPSGDATEVLVGTPLPNAPSLDVTKGYLSYDARAKQLVVHTKVLDLSQTPPTGATGEQYEFGFTYDKVAYFAVAARSSGSPNDFHMESPLRTGVGPPLSGSFDAATSEVRVNVPADFFSKAGKGKPLTKGSKLTGFAITTRRNEAGLIVPNADEAGSLGCPFVVGARSSTSAGGPQRPVDAGTVPSRIDRRPVPGLAATGLPMGVPLMAVGLVLGAGLLVRRRIQ
ncbi:MAG: sialidase family protein, partial [Mycobacteriales bacterium]